MTAEPHPVRDLRTHAAMPDTCLWAELGLTVPQAREVIGHIDTLTRRLRQATITTAVIGDGRTP